MFMRMKNGERGDCPKAYDLKPNGNFMKRKTRQSSKD
jgi:hypothetical protein